MTISERIDYILCRCRNIIYYDSIDERERVQYIHVFRKLKNDIGDILKEISDNNILIESNLKNVLIKIDSIIPIKVTNDESKEIINKLKLIMEDVNQF